eukprot:1374906-Amphidinium_carterae.1
MQRRRPSRKFVALLRPVGFGRGLVEGGRPTLWLGEISRTSKACRPSSTVLLLSSEGPQCNGCVKTVTSDCVEGNS